MKLPGNLLFLILSLFVSYMVHAQGTDADRSVQQIRKEYQRINKAKLKAKTINWINEECPPYSEGKVTFYYENNRLVKIFYWGSEDHGEWKEEYYFKDGSLFFIYQNNAWGGAGDPGYYTLQRRIYIKDGKAFKILESSSVKDLAKAAAKEIERYITIANLLKAATTEEQIVEIMFCAEE